MSFIAKLRFRSASQTEVVKPQQKVAQPKMLPKAP